MAGTFTSTGTISNLTRLELEQLRKADFTAGGKALTKGDSGQTVGVGDFNAEQFFTTPAVRLEDVSSMSPPSNPAASLGTLIQDSAQTITSTNRFIVRWYGPRLIHSGVFNNTRVVGFNSTTVEKDSNVNNGEALDDYMVLGTKDSGSDQNTYLVGTITGITTTVSTRRFALTNIYNPLSGTPTNVEFANGSSYRYSVWRRDVVQLFAYPGSGPATGREQTFLMVNADPLLFLRAVPSATQSGNRITAAGQDFTASPAVQVGDTFNIGFVQGTVTQIPPSAGLANDQLDVSFSGSGSISATISRSLHKMSGPTTDQINSVRVRNIVPPNYTSVSSKDRSDAIFPPVTPATRTNGADTLGYRVILYRSLPNGTGPDFDNPITSLNPIIDPSIPSTDQRFTIDYKAGIVRFSCAPSNVPNGAIQPDIKPVGGNGGCDPTTGRLNLYATFMAIDDSFTKRSAEALKAPTQDSNGRPTSATITAGNINTLGSSWDVLPGRLRLNNANGAVGADPILYESSGVLKTGRADLSETDANQPPVLEHRGQLLVGGGLVGVSARMIPRIKHALSPYLEVGSEGSRTLRSETTRGTSNFAATREYGYDANYTDYDMYEQTHNARWDSPSQTWVKDQGGTPASRLYVHNIGLVFQTEDSLASSFTTAAWSPGPINVGAITATAATIGGVAFSTVSSNLTTLTNDYNNHATSSSTHHDGRYSQIGHGHNGTYLRIVFVHDDFFTNGQEKIFFEAKADHIFYTTNIGNFYYHAHNNNFWNAFDIAQRNDGQMTVKNNTGTDCNVRITGVIIT